MSGGRILAKAELEKQIVHKANDLLKEYNDCEFDLDRYEPSDMPFCGLRSEFQRLKDLLKELDKLK